MSTNLETLKKGLAKGTINVSELIEMANSSIELAKAIAKNKKTPSSVLDYLSHANDPNVQILVAKNPNSNETTLERLSKSPVIDITIAIAKNASSSKNTLLFLSKHASRKVRIAMLSGYLTITGEYRINLIARDSDHKVRVELVKNLAWLLSQSVYRHLILDQHPEVRTQIVLSNRVGLSALVSEGYLKQYLEDENPVVRAAFADTYVEYDILREKPELLKILVDDVEPEVRRAGFRYGDSSIWKKLVNDPSFIVRKSAGWFFDHIPDDLEEVEIIQLANDPNIEVRLAFANMNRFRGYPDKTYKRKLSVDFLRLLSVDSEPEIRFRICKLIKRYIIESGHPWESVNSLKEILNILTNDGSKNIFQARRWRKKLMNA